MNAVALLRTVFLILTIAAISNAQSSTTRPSPDSPTTNPAGVGKPATVALLEHIQQTLKKVQTVEADFVQEKHLKILDQPLIIRGHFALQKPDRLIWIVREPVRYAVRIEGEEVRQWDEDTKRVDVIHLGGDPTFKAISDQIQSWFLGDYEALAKSYDVVLLSEKPLMLAFTPKPDSMVAKLLKRVAVTFADDEQYIDQMVIDEAGGDSTTLKFVRTQVNQRVKENVWRMPPDER